MIERGEAIELQNIFFFALCPSIDRVNNILWWLSIPPEVQKKKKMIMTMIRRNEQKKVTKSVLMKKKNCIPNIHCSVLLPFLLYTVYALVAIMVSSPCICFFFSFSLCNYIRLIKFNFVMRMIKILMHIWYKKNIR